MWLGGASSSCSLTRSTMILGKAEKAGGDLVQPMGNLEGMAMSGVSPGRFRNGTTSLSFPDGVSGSW